MAADAAKAMVTNANNGLVNYRAYPVLYVDDEPANLKTFAFTFDDRFEVLTASSAAEALTIIAQRPIAVLLSDQRMPGMTGTELCARVRESHPDVVRMIVTAYADISAAVAAINAGQVNRYVLKPWRDEEMAELLRGAIEAFQLASLTREMQGRLLRADQQATSTYVLGRLLHELANPATAVRDNVFWMAQAVTQLAGLVASAAPEVTRLVSDIQGALQDTSEAAGQLAARIDRFRQGEIAGVRPEASTWVGQSVRAAMAMLRAEVRKRARLTLEMVQDVAVIADSVQLSQILLNLIMNACEAIEPGKPEENEVRIHVSRRLNSAVIAVEDTGSGVSPDVLPKLFQPFVTSKGDKDSRGLGLAIVKDIIQGLGGSIRVEPAAQSSAAAEAGAIPRGSRFIVELPAAR